MVTGTVYTYKSQTLRKLISEATDPISPLASLDLKKTILYLDGYLRVFNRKKEKHQAQAIVVETGYVDRDFMRDYSGFYSGGFTPIERRTTRLHFFANRLTQESFDRLITAASGNERDDAIKELQAAYLGFTVIRPLATNFIGRTCVKNYPAHKQGELTGEGPEARRAALKEERHYPVLHRYEVDLFGIPLSVMSVAFQEQAPVGACATMALYTTLHACKRRFDTQLLSPLEITNLATRLQMPTGQQQGSVTQAFPNPGLSVEQVKHVLAECGLTPVVFKTGNNPQTRADALALIYAYLSSGLPVLVYSPLTNRKDKKFNPQKRVHMFVLTGFSLAMAPVRNVVLASTEGIHLKGHRINKVYVHDDRIGPFSKFWVTQKGGLLAFEPRAIKKLRPDETTEDVPCYDTEGDLAVPFDLIIPGGDKLRLPFQAVTRLVGLIEGIFLQRELLLAFEWDVRLAFVDQVREDYVQDTGVNEQSRRRVLKESLPRLVWRATATRNGENLFEVLVDATSVQIDTAILMIIPASPQGQSLFGDLTPYQEEILASQERKDPSRLTLATAIFTNIQKSLASEVPQKS